MNNIEAATIIIELYARYEYRTQKDAKAVAMACATLMEHYDYEEPEEVSEDG